MTRLVPLVALLAGCGRLAFDATGDAGSSDGRRDTPAGCVAVGHDEDGDGVDDACDVCPQRDDNGADSDGDGVGDTCDLSSLAQTRVLFDPFTSMLPAWTLVGGTYDSEDMLFDNLTSGAGAILAPPPGRETFELTGSLLQADAAQAQIQLAIGEADPGPGHYYCELYDGGSGLILSLTTTPDGVGFTTIASLPLPGRFDAGDFTLIFDHLPLTSTCYADWKGARYSVGGNNPPAIPLDQFAIVTFQVQARMHSFVRLSTP